MTITERDLAIARWRLRGRFRVPKQDLDDFLQDACVDFLKQKPDLNEDGKYDKGNWLAKVSYFKYLDSRKPKRVRMTRPWPEHEGVRMDFEAPQEQDHTTENVE